VAARNGNAELQSHEFGQQFAAWNHWDLQTARFRHFRVRRIERGRDNHRFGSGDIFGAMTHLDRCAQFGEPVRDRAQFGVRPRNLVSESEQNFSDRAHSNAPDTNKVDVLGLKKHFLPLLFRLYGLVSNKNPYFY
jgi:hypothetical protein